MMKLVFAIFLVVAISRASCLVGMAKHRAGLSEVANFFAKIKEGQEMVLLDLKTSVRGDPTKCLQDQSEVASDKFVRCQRIFGEDPTSINATAARAFCQDHCSTFLVNLLEKLVHDCDLPPSTLPDAGTIALLSKTCSTSGGHYCLELWSTLDSSDIDPDYSRCVSQFDGRGSCPNECKRAEQWVINSLGCCYRVMLDYAISQGETGFLSSDYWHSCGLKEPSTCP